MINKTVLLTTLATVSLTTCLIPSKAMALTFNWSFVVGPGSTGQVGQTISGTISGLKEGSNDGSGLTVTVDSTPTGAAIGGDWSFSRTKLNGDAFTVTGGKVTFADARYYGTDFNQTLYFGGFGGYIPELYLNNIDWYTQNRTTFIPVASTPTPESSNILALLGLGVSALALNKKKLS